MTALHSHWLLSAPFLLLNCSSSPAEFLWYVRDLEVQVPLPQPSLNITMMFVPRRGGQWSLAQTHQVTSTETEERQWRIKEFQKLGFIKALACPESSIGGVLVLQEEPILDTGLQKTLV